MITSTKNDFDDSKSFYSKDPFCEYYKEIIPNLIWKVFENPEGVKKLL